MEFKLALKNMVFHGFHGDLEVERELGQKFLVDVEVFYFVSQKELGERAPSPVSYQKLYELALEFLTAHKYTSIESLAYHLAVAILKRFDRAEAVSVLVRRPQLFITGPADAVELEFVLEREELEEEEA